MLYFCRKRKAQEEEEEEIKKKVQKEWDKNYEVSCEATGSAALAVLLLRLEWIVSRILFLALCNSIELLLSNFSLLAYYAQL